MILEKNLHMVILTIIVYLGVRVGGVIMPNDIIKK